MECANHPDLGWPAFRLAPGASLIVSAMLSTPRNTHIVQHESMLPDESIGNVIEERAKLPPCVLIEGGFPLEDLHGSLEFSRASTCGRDGQRHLR